MNTKFYISINLLLLLSGIIYRVQAQVHNYTFSQGLSQDYAVIPTYGAQLDTLKPPGSSANLLKVLYVGGDTGTVNEYATGAGYSIGFNFMYHGESFDRVAVSGNGYIKLGHSGQLITIKNDTVPGLIFDGSSYNQNVLASFQTDVHALSLQSNRLTFPTLIEYGVPGNRVFVVRFNVNTTDGNIWVLHQIELWEKDNSIRYTYVNSVDYYADIHLQAAVGITSGNDFSNLVVTEGSNNWSSAVREAVANDLCDFSSACTPPGSDGVTHFMYSWMPSTPVPSAPVSPVAFFYVDTFYTGTAKINYARSGLNDLFYILADSATEIPTNATLNWSDGTVAAHQPTTYDLYLDISYPPATLLAQEVSATSYTLPALAPNTTYYYSIVSRNASGKDSACTGSFVTASLPQMCDANPKGDAYIRTVNLHTFSFALNSNNHLMYTFPAEAPYTTSLKRDTSYSCSVTLTDVNTSTDPWSNAQVKMWIDFNQDGDFDDPDEAMSGGGAGPNGSFSFDVVIPDQAKLGQTAMRIASKNIADTRPFLACNSNYFMGGSQDFIITIAPSTRCQDFSVHPSVTNVRCYGQQDGSIQLNASGGTMPYLINWSNGSLTDEINNLPKGIYQATVTDANHCEISTPLLPLFQPSILSTDTTIDADHVVTVHPSGGTTPYSYLWSNGAMQNNTTSFANGTYSVIVTDAHACYTTLEGIVVQKDTIIIPPPPDTTDTTRDSSLNITVYPNPTSGIFYITYPIQQAVYLQFINESGKLIRKEWCMLSADAPTPVDITSLPRGLYFLKISGDQSIVVKVIRL